MLKQAPVPVTVPARPALRITWHIEVTPAGRSVVRARWSVAGRDRRLVGCAKAAAAV
jgi:hypothetical protein